MLDMYKIIDNTKRIFKLEWILQDNQKFSEVLYSAVILIVDMKGGHPKNTESHRKGLR
ncbi:MAG: hypothetical protein RIR48_2489 [Bacteroidota bacterium]